MQAHLVSRCLLNQAQQTAQNAARLRGLYETVGDSNSLKLHQWIHFYALASEYEPDLIIEFGRGYGNSTCLFAEALSHMTGKRRIVSLCNSSCWDEETLPKLKKKGLVDQKWLSTVDARTLDILSVDYEEVVGDAKRVLVLWDAHGTEVADCVLAKLMPIVGDREHFVVMHDISDARYVGNSKRYNGLPFWRGQEAGWSGESAKLHLGWLETVVEQAIPAIDFTIRNGLELGSADHQVKLDICDNAEVLNSCDSIYPQGFFGTVNHWAFFTLNDTEGPYTYPRYLPLSAAQAVRQAPRYPGLDHQIQVDLARYRWFGRRSPFTYARVFAKMVLGRYASLDDARV